MDLTLPKSLSAEQNRLIESAVEQLAKVSNVLGVVLGGSHARGTAQRGSDVDLGVYYSERSPFAIESIREIACSLDVTGLPTVSGLYEWGPWVNGGAWIETAVGKLDLLFRNLDQVRKTIAEIHLGVHHRHYDQQPTHGFYSVSYLADLETAWVLLDPRGLLVDLKRSVPEYPSKLRNSVVRESLWSAEFTIYVASTFAARGDVYNTVGCLARISAALTQAIYAMNSTYFPGDKGALEPIHHFPYAPVGYVTRLSRILAHPGSSSRELEQSMNLIGQLWSETVTLTNGTYRPKYNLERE